MLSESRYYHGIPPWYYAPCVLISQLVWKVSLFFVYIVNVFIHVYWIQAYKSYCLVSLSWRDVLLFCWIIIFKCDSFYTKIKGYDTWIELKAREKLLVLNLVASFFKQKVYVLFDLIKLNWLDSFNESYLFFNIIDWNMPLWNMP